MKDRRRTAPVDGAGGRAATGAIAFLSGPGLLDELGSELDELALAAGTPVTARRRWLSAWIRAYRPSGTWGVAVRDPATGRLDAVACFSDHDRGCWDEVAPLGRRQQDRGALPARSDTAARVLAAAVIARLRARTRPWALRMGQLPAGDPVAAALADGLGSARSLPGVPIPKIEFGTAASVDEWLGQGMRKQLRKCRRRVDDEGLDMEIDFVAEAGAVEAVLVEVERTHRARERHAQRESELESQPGLEFWRTVILEHAAAGEAEIGTLRLDGELAAYVVSLLDDDAYRVFDGRFAPALARYSPGRLLETAVIERALADSRFARIDWMNGCAVEKLLAANAVDHTEHLVAFSPGAVIDLDVVGSSPAGIEHRMPGSLASGGR